MSKRAAASRVSYVEVGSSDEEILESESDVEERPKKKKSTASLTKKASVQKKATKSSRYDVDDDDEEDDYEDEEEEDKSSESEFEITPKQTSASQKKNSASISKTLPPKKSAKFVENRDIPDVETVLKLVRKLPRRKITDLSVLKELTGILEVADLEHDEVVLKIEDLVVSIVSQILKGTAFELDVPNRNNSNQVYIEKIDRNVLGAKISKREFLNVGQSRKVAITTRVMELIHEVLTKGIHVTKRDLFYTDVKLFKEQTESDAVLDDVACMVGCTRTSLNVVASDKGLVVGRIQYREAGDYIDCTKMGVGGKAIPPYVDQITDITSDAEFVILVEKEAAYMRLAEDRFYKKYPCIVITGKGQPDVATRLFLRKITDQLKIPVLALVDSDPYGLKILSVYCSGSKNMSYDSSNLTTSDIKWLGVRPSDLDRYNLPEQCRLPISAHDRKTGEELLNEPFIQKNSAWVEEIELMLRTGEKAEIQALSSYGFQYLTEQFLPRKLLEGDWI